MEEVETRNSNICDIAILPPTSCEQEISDEEDDNGLLDKDYRKDEVAGEVEIHDISTKSEECITTDASPQWRKKKHLSLGPHEAVLSSDNVQQHVDKDSFESFSLFFTPKLVDYMTQQTNLYAK